MIFLWNNINIHYSHLPGFFWQIFGLFFFSIGHSLNIPVVLAFSEMSGVGMVRCPNSKDLFILNHLEYDANTLNDEFSRDNPENIEIKIPENYFPQNDVNKTPINRWRPYAFLLFTNFINEVYQDVPFDFKRIDFKN